MWHIISESVIFLCQPFRVLGLSPIMLGMIGSEEMEMKVT
jgi:hypothetical protein